GHLAVRPRPETGSRVGFVAREVAARIRAGGNDAEPLRARVGECRLREARRDLAPAQRGRREGVLQVEQIAPPFVDERRLRAVQSHDEALARLSRHIPETLAAKIRTAQHTIAGERKQVTVLFCDLAGSTAIAERLDPEEYHDLLDEYLELAFREIYRFEGIVNQIAGDGLMALFGAPVAHEDAPQRAIRAALAIEGALGSLNERLRGRGLELQARIGINTGPVVVGT